MTEGHGAFNPATGIAWNWMALLTDEDEPTFLEGVIRKLATVNAIQVVPFERGGRLTVLYSFRKEVVPARLDEGKKK